MEMSGEGLENLQPLPPYNYVKHFGKFAVATPYNYVIESNCFKSFQKMQEPYIIA